MAEHLPDARLQPVDGPGAVWFTSREVADVVTAYAASVTTTHVR